MLSLLFFFNDTATTEIYTLSLHDALPISRAGARTDSAAKDGEQRSARESLFTIFGGRIDRKSTRLNSSHQIISYAVFCLKKKKKTITAHMVGTTSICTRDARRQLCRIGVD